MQRLCDELRASTDRIVELWTSAAEREPWILPRQHALPDFVPDLVSAIADATVCDPPTRESVYALAEAAALHAAGRAAQGTDHSRVVIEYYFLRSAIWAYLDERNRNVDEDLRAILYVDVAVSVATRAALLGYYRKEYEQQGGWRSAVDRLVDETPLLWDRTRRPATPAAPDGAPEAGPAPGP
jgi:hypothetical protein